MMEMTSRTADVISAHSSWLCTSQKQLSDVLTTTQDIRRSEKCCLKDDALDRWEPVCLERVEEDSPCVVTLRCPADSACAISSIQFVSEGRTLEVYSGSGEYCGTCRGEEVQRSVSDGSEERKPYYSSFMVLESPTSSCEVKLLSFGGRSSVAIAHVSVGLETLKERQSSSTLDPSIDLQRVQAMMEEMGTNLSPGAQNLMELVQSQQKNKSDMLSGFIPLLMGGGALSCLSRGGGASSATEEDRHPPSGLEQLLSTSGQNLMKSAMSGPINPEIFPMLQSVCGQVTQLRLEEATSPDRKKNGERESHTCCGGFEKMLESVVEKRMEEMERRLKDHMDLRLEALHQKLEVTLQQALSHMPKHQ